MLRVIGQAERILSEGVPADPDDVREYCIDLSRLPDFNPGGSIRAVSQRNSADRASRDASRGFPSDEAVYQVRDGFTLGFLTVPVVYSVRMRVPVAGALSAEANPVPTVRLDAVVAFEPLETGTRLREYLRISAPRPVLGVVVDRTVAVHTALLAGVRRHFEGLS